MNADPAPVPEGELSLVGRLTSASNATFLARIGEVDVVYKPLAGEAPLWDFPDGTLGNRELAAHEVSQELGWAVTPPTQLRSGPLGLGMVQRWVEPAVGIDVVRLCAADEDPGAGWRYVLDGVDAADLPISLFHEDSPALRRMAVFDVLTNNADRKGAHILAVPGHRHGVDHGLTFHVEHKLRTILWGWAGQRLSEDEIDGVARVRDGLDGDLGERLYGLLTVPEVVACADRCEQLLARPRFPRPAGHHPAIPWPPL